MYTRSYGSRPSISPRTLPPDYGGTALVIPQPEPEPTPTPPPRPEPRSESEPAPPPSLPRPDVPPRPLEPSRPDQGGRPPRPLFPPRRPRFTGRRSPIVTRPPMPQEPDFDPRRSEERESPPSSRRDPLGAPPFGGGAEPFEGGGQPYGRDAQDDENTDRAFPESETPRENDRHFHERDGREDGNLTEVSSPFSALSLRQDDLLLLGLLIFLLHEQDEGETDCRDALLLLAVLFVSGL